MKRQLVSIGFTAAIALSGQAIAQAPPSGGELSQVFACFYECKPGPTVQGIPTWQEITTLMVMNANSGVPDPFSDTRIVNAVFLDGNENILGSSLLSAGAGLDLSPEDLDEIHVCRTLQQAGLPVPQAGIVEFYVAGGDPGGAYAWVKNLIGKFFVNVDEPFDGRVTGIAKTECRQVPLEVSTPMEIAQKAIASGAPQNVELILVEDTAEDSNFNLCCGPNDLCIDVDGITTASRGGFSDVDVAVGNPLTFWVPNGAVGAPPEGLDWFDNDTSCSWTLGDDLHLEDPIGACGTALRNGVHDLGLDCKVLDLNGSLFTGQPVDVDLEGNGDFRPPTVCPNMRGIDPRLGFYDANGDGGYNNTEDIVLDRNRNGICD